MANKEIQKSERAIVGDYLKGKINGLKKLLGDTSKEQEFMNGAHFLICQDKNLQACLNSKDGEISLFNALQRAASTGISLNPQFAQGTIIAYKDKTGKYQANFQLMKNGLIALALESPEVETMTADAVYTNDTFRISKAVTGDIYHHDIALTDRGPALGYYAAILMTNGRTNVKYMSAQQVWDHAKIYGRSMKPDSAWGKSFDGMAIKTVIKALLRNMYIKTVVKAVVEDDKKEAAIREEKAAADRGPGSSPEDLAGEIAATVERVEPAADKPTDQPAGGTDAKTADGAKRDGAKKGDTF